MSESSDLKRVINREKWISLPLSFILKMKEKFRDWNFRGKIKIKYTDGTGNKNTWEKDQNELLNEIITIVKSYMYQGITLTNRQLYYQLVSRDIIPNADEVYKRVCTFITDARYSGLIDWKAIEDRGRTPEKHSEWENIKELIESATYTYRLPRWKDQSYYVELYCEKQAMESVLKPVADKYHIYFGVNKGYSSASTMYDLAQRIKEQIKQGKKSVILYLGDHDPSGLDMVRDVRDRIKEFLIGSEDLQDIYNDLEWEAQEDVADKLREEYDYNDEEFKELYTKFEEDEEKSFDCGKAYVYDLLKKNFEVLPLALNMAQIRLYNPPPNPAKITDPRAGWYIQEYGKKSWELDALEPKILMQIAENGIRKFLDIDKYNAVIQKEKDEKKALEEFGDSLLKNEKKEVLKE